MMNIKNKIEQVISLVKSIKHDIGVDKSSLVDGGKIITCGRYDTERGCDYDTRHKINELTRNPDFIDDETARKNVNSLYDVSVLLDDLKNGITDTLDNVICNIQANSVFVKPEIDGNLFSKVMYHLTCNVLKRRDAYWKSGDESDVVKLLKYYKDHVFNKIDKEYEIIPIGPSVTIGDWGNWSFDFYIPAKRLIINIETHHISHGLWYSNMFPFHNKEYTPDMFMGSCIRYGNPDHANKILCSVPTLDDAPEKINEFIRTYDPYIPNSTWNPENWIRHIDSSHERYINDYGSTHIAALKDIMERYPECDLNKKD